MGFIVLWKKKRDFIEGLLAHCVYVRLFWILSETMGTRLFTSQTLRAMKGLSNMQSSQMKQGFQKFIDHFRWIYRMYYIMAFMLDE